MDNIFSKYNLLKAWDSIKAKNKSGGADNITIKDFNNELEINIQNLDTELKSGKYIPEPYKRVYIPKNENEYRPLAIMSIKDKIVQMCVLNCYQNEFDKMFVDTSYAYRINKSHVKAVNRVSDYLLKGYKWFANVDIDNFFDTIDRNLLIIKCKEYFKDEYICKLLEMWIRIGVIFKDNYKESPKGIAQGGIISPLLSNLYMHEYDLELKRNRINNVRYSDNILFIENTKTKLENNLEYAEDHLTKQLNLKLNYHPQCILHKDNGFIFLGIFFLNNKRTISPGKIEYLKGRLLSLLNNDKLKLNIDDFNVHFSGVRRFYAKFDAKDQLIMLEEFFKNNLTEILIKAKRDKQNIKYSALANFINRLEFYIEKNPSEKKQIIETITSKLKYDKQNNISNSKEINNALRNKKKKYLKLAYSNLELVLSNPGTQLGKLGDKITIRRDGKIINTVSSNKTENILISSKGVTISSDLVNLCSEKNIRIDFFDEIGRPYSSVISSSSPFYSISNLQLQSFLSGKSKILSRNLIYAKVKNQVALLKYFTKNEYEKNSEWLNDVNSEIEKISSGIEKIKNILLGCEQSEFRDKLFGLEGVCATSYWKAISLLLPDSCDFEKREHYQAKDLVNMSFNYAYGILYTRIFGNITISGLNPQIGFFHSEQKGKPVLVFDLIEPFRAPIADRTVIAMLNKGTKLTKEGGLLSKDSRKKLSEKILQRLNSEVLYEKRYITYNEIIFLKTKELVSYLKGDSNTYKPYILKW